MPRNILQSSLLSAGISIIFQIFCRFLTFGINAYIVRNIDRDVMGIMNVRLLLLESTLIFLSREAINRAALSANSQSQSKCNWAQLINQMWLTVPICLTLCVPCLYIWLYCLSGVKPSFNEQYTFACYAFAVSCILELIAEAPVFVVQVFCFVKLKVVLDTLHILLRSVIFLYIVIGEPSQAIKAFAIAQFVSALTIVVCHYGFFYYYIKRFNNNDDHKSWEKPLYANMQDFPFKQLREMLPGFLPNESKTFNKQLQVLTLSFVKQGVLKQILTEGEKYVMSISPVLSFSEQATYDIVNNLGSLAARFIFRPIEDSSYFYFAQTLSRDIKLRAQDKAVVQQASKVLRNLLMAVTSIGLLAFTFGQSYAHTVLLFYGGSDFVAGGLPQSLLQWHSLAISFLAINGITEGYMFATNTSKDIDRYNYLMALFSISFLFLSYALTSFFGPVGFIFANCINMFCRICYSTNFIYKQYRSVGLNPLTGIVPGRYFVAALLTAGIVCKYSMYTTQVMLTHIAIGAFAIASCLVAWSLENKELVRLAYTYGRHIKID